jgi:hypothetical protein
MPEEVSELMAGYDGTWWLAGGWAVDSLVGHQTRQHADVDVLVLRDQQDLIRRHLVTWDVHVADPPGSGKLRPWPLEETLPETVHDVWCRQSRDAPWSCQFMIDNRVGDHWVFRRDGRIRRPLDELTGRASRPWLPVLTVEVQLLYKSGSPRPKDEVDFDTALPLLSSSERRWLERALDVVRPDHPWRARLGGTPA